MTRTALLLMLVLIGLFMSVTSGQAQDYGSNWSATFYNSPNLTGVPAAMQTGLNGVNFNWGTGSPAAGVMADNFSARFTSTQTFQSGPYLFTASSDDGIRVFIDNQLVLDKFVPRIQATDTFTRNMSAGNHNLTVEYFDAADQAIVQFNWSYQAVPPTPLPPVPEGALTAVIVRASVLNIRNAPFVGAQRVTRALRGQTYAVVGRNEEATWFLLQLTNGQGWAWYYYLAFNGNEFNAPVVSPYSLMAIQSDTGVVAQTIAGLRLRAEPTVHSRQIGRIPWGALLPVIGRRGAWWQVVWFDTVGWVYAPFVEVREGDLNNVPEV